MDEGGIVVAHDIAVLRLDRALEMDPIRVGPSTPEGPFTMVGYGRDAPGQQVVQEACAGSARRGRWYLDCPVTKGMSGGPVLYGNGAGRRVAGVISGISGAESVVVPVDPWVLQSLARPYTP